MQHASALVVGSLTIWFKVSAKLDKLRDDKAAGADDLLPRFLNCIKKEIISPIVILFKKVLREETVPSDWTDANVDRYTAIYSVHPYSPKDRWSRR